MDNSDILSKISFLVQREHHLRTARERGSLTADTELEELAQAEVELDQCWDLLRQRRALQAVRRDPNQAHVRPVEQVENYLPRPGRSR